MKVDWLLGLILFSAVLGAIGTAVANREKDLPARRARWLKYGVFLCIVLGFTLCILFSRSGLALLSGLVLIGGAFELWYVPYRSGEAPLGRPVYLLVAALYAGIGYSFLQMVVASADDLLLLLFLAVFSFDAFSQICGQLVGKRLLFPRTSPQKTYEGLLGGVLASMLACILIGGLEDPGLGLLQSTGLGLFLSASALGGDYLASRYKRLHGVKDYSRLLPGQGGFLDRFDSLLLSGALLYWALMVT